MAGGAVTPSPAHPPEAPALELAGVDAAPPGAARATLSGVNLRLERGEIGVLLGGNGAGKTTLLRTAAGLWPARAGTVRPPAAGFDPRRAGLVLEDPAVQFVAGTVAGEIEFVLENRGLSGEAVARRRDRILARFDLEALAGRDPLKLSAGEQQRALVAAALVLEPPLLLLDDPFLYLAADAARAAWERVREAVRGGEVGAALLATHDAEQALDADRAGVLGDGRLLFWGPPEAAVRAGLPGAVDPPLGAWLEAALAREGFRLPPGGLGPDAMAERIAAALATAS